MLDLRRFALATVLSTLGYLLLPNIHGVSAGATELVFRCLMAGCVAGLLMLRPSPWWSGAAATVAAIAFGTFAVELIAPAHVSPAAIVGGVILGGAVATGLSWLASSRMMIAESLALAAVVFILLWHAGIVPGAIRTAGFDSQQTALSAPQQPKHYGFDGDSFLRTYELMKKGDGYYAAFRQGINEDARHDASVLTSPFNYREPFVFYLWRVLPGDTGAAVWDWFVVYAVLVLICSYVLASSLASRGVALLAPIALVSYFYFFFYADNSWFAITEIWSAGFGVAAVMCLVRRWYVPSLVLLTAAVAAREFMVLLIPAWLLVAWFSRARKANWWFPAAAILGPALVLGAHFLAVPPTAGANGGVGGWLHGSPARLIDALRFGSHEMLAWQWAPLVIAAAAIAGAALARPRWRMASLLVATILPTLFLLFFGTVEDGRQWGAFYSPLAISIAPAVFARWLPPETA